MSDSPDNTSQPRADYGLFASLRKLVATIVVLFIAWLIFGQLVPYFMAGTEAPIEVPAGPDVTGMFKERDEQIATLQERLHELETQISALKAAAPAAAPAPDTSVMETRLKAMEERLEALQQAPRPAEAIAGAPGASSAAVEEKLQALKAQIDDLKTRGNQRLSALAAAHAVREAISRGESFGALLAQISQLVPDDPAVQGALAELRPHGEQGGITLAALQSKFNERLTKTLTPDANSNDFASNLQSLIRIRKTGEQQQGSDDEAVLARAEAKLSRGDVMQCIGELAGLSPEAAAIFAPWVSKAQLFVRLRKLADSLQLALAQHRPQDKALGAP